MLPNTGAEAKTPETPDQDQARSVAPPGESSTTIPRSQAGSDKEPSAAAQVPQTSPQTRGAAGTLPLRTLCHRPSAHQPNTSTIDVGREDHGPLSPRIKHRMLNPPLPPLQALLPYGKRISQLYGFLTQHGVFCSARRPPISSPTGGALNVVV